MSVDTLVGFEHESLAVGATSTIAEQRPGLAFVVIGAGHAIDGGVRSTTVTTPVAWPNAPLGSVAVNRTDVVPSGYGDGGICANDSGSPSASHECFSIDASATHWSLATAVTSV